MNKGEKADWLDSYKNLAVVVDIDPGHVLIGDLLDFSSEHLLLRNADLHNCRDANSTKEVYLHEASSFGVNVNRKEVAIPRSRVIAISKLADTNTV